MTIPIGILESSATQAGSGVDAFMVVQEFDTTGSPLDVTSPECGGATPTAAIVVMTNHRASNDPGDSNHAAVGIGLFDSGGGKGTGFGTRSMNNQGNTTERTITGNDMVMPVETTTSFSKLATVSFITDGIRLTFSRNNDGDWRGYVILFVGAELEAQAGVINLGTGTSAITTGSLPFEPEAVFFLGSTVGGSSNAFNLSFGCSLSDDTQRMFTINEQHFQPAGDPRSILSKDKVNGQLSAGTLDWSIAASNFTADSFDVTPSASAGNDNVSYLALNFGGAQFSLFDIDIPSSTGSDAKTGLGFQPGGMLTLATNLQTADVLPASANDNYSGFGMSGVTAAESWGAGWRIESGADPTVTAVAVKDQALVGGDDASAQAMVANLTSFDADGYTLNYSSAPGIARIGFGFALEVK